MGQLRYKSGYQGWILLYGVDEADDKCAAKLWPNYVTCKIKCLNWPDLPYV